MTQEKENPIAGMEVLDGIHLFPEMEAILAVDTAGLFNPDYDIEPLVVGPYKVAPWGTDNLLPQHVRKKAESNDIVSANLNFTSNVCFGLGPKLIRALAWEKGKMVDFEEVTSGKEFDFFERNDIPLFMQQQLNDMVEFWNVWCRMDYAKDGNDIYTIRHREAMFSRWEMQNRRGDINWHYYCAGWDQQPGTDKYPIIASRVIDEFNAVEELKMYAASKNRPKGFIFSAYMPSPGHVYYSRPSWYSIFNSGWYDHSTMVPQLKKAILKNQLGVKYIIYVSPDYFADIFKKEGIPETDRAKRQERINKEKNAIIDFLTGAENANKGIMTLKKMMPSASGGAIEQKWIEIVPVQNDMKGGEYIDDTESTANIICYAMGVHSALIGATPGKNSNALGGSNARELYLIKQAMMKPLVDRCMRSLKVVKEYNKWDKNIFISIPEYIFTTLDQNKSGKQESTEQNA